MLPIDFIYKLLRKSRLFDSHMDKMPMLLHVEAFQCCSNIHIATTKNKHIEHSAIPFEYFWQICFTNLGKKIQNQNEN